MQQQQSTQSAILLFGAMGTCQQQWGGPVNRAIVEQQLSDLKEAKVIPDVLPEFEPTSFIKLMYDDKPVVNAGDVIFPHQATKPPHVWFPAPSEDAHYTLVLVDADANVPLVRHWIVENVPGNIRDNIPYTPYHGPTPPALTGKHRYVFALYEQPMVNQTLVPPIVGDPDRHRAFFDLHKFANENSLTLVAATYVQAEHEDGYEGRGRAPSSVLAAAASSSNAANAEASNISMMSSASAAPSAV
ncbi:PEBP-like protein [Lichtheimia hyalospora FSU 10163]|nr:PEBP-like protein [Lichtheimia hyalospora FSU 10163]